MTMGDLQQTYELTASIKAKLTIYLSKRITRRTYDDSRLLLHLPVTTLDRINTSLDTLYSQHVYQFLAGTNTPLDPEFIDAYLDLLPQLTEKQRFIASEYFINLTRWLTGSALNLDLMVRFSTQYREATGSVTLPYTSEIDQQLFTRLSKAPHLIDLIMERAHRTSEFTPELLNELASVHPALVDGAL